MSARIVLANFQYHSRCKPRGRVHRDIKANQVRRGDGIVVERLSRQIEAENLVPLRAQPRRRRSQAKRLPAKFVRGYKKNVHPDLGSLTVILTEAHRAGTTIAEIYNRNKNRDQLKL